MAKGVGTNYLSGFWDTGFGYYYQNEWVNSEYIHANFTNWLLTVDQNVSLGGICTELLQLQWYILLTHI